VYDSRVSAKGCPLCHRPNAGDAWQCACGYEFGQSIERVLELLRSQRRNARIMLVILLVLDAMAAVVVGYAARHGFAWVSVLGFAALVTATLRTVRTLGVTRASLRQLDKPIATLPSATVHQR
jgi:hypothetical protein